MWTMLDVVIPWYLTRLVQKLWWLGYTNICVLILQYGQTQRRWIRTNLWRLQPLNVSCNIQMLILYNTMVSFGNFCIVLSSEFIFVSSEDYWMCVCLMILILKDYFVGITTNSDKTKQLCFVINICWTFKGYRQTFEG